MYKFSHFQQWWLRVSLLFSVFHLAIGVSFLFGRCDKYEVTALITSIMYIFLTTGATEHPFMCLLYLELVFYKVSVYILSPIFLYSNMPFFVRAIIIIHLQLCYESIYNYPIIVSWSCIDPIYTRGSQTLAMDRFLSIAN